MTAITPNIRKEGRILDPIRMDNRALGGVILVVSNDATLVFAAREALETPQVQIIVPESAMDAPARAKARQPQLIVVDGDKTDLAMGDGSLLLEALKNSPYTAAVPVLVVLPPHTGEDKQLELLRRGALDVIVRPDSQELLLLKLKTFTLRQPVTEEAPEVLTSEGLILDLRSRKVTVDNTPVALTRKEFDLLNMLLRKRGLVAYTTHLYHTVWGYGESSPVDSHTVKVHISSLRSKLGPTLGRKIVNLPGLGYRFDD
jgi:two-component system KDP operon response regulator KdpE